MGAIFAKTKKKESRVTEQDKAILQLKQQRDKLKQYQKKIILNLEKEKEVARQLLKNGKKDKALLLLKKKKFQEQMLTKTDSQLDNLETMVHDIEFAQVEMKVLDGLKVGNEALKKMHDVLSVEDVEKIMDETQEGIAKQREIDELISGSFTEEDDASVLEELDKLIADSLPEVEKEEEEEEEESVKLPDVPSEEPLAEQQKKKTSKSNEEKVLVAA
ncbi:Charged multivesicular body protein 6 [Nymphon striatum]|nr:Charged multivesicular body protein 6 [Nymphon striatum]